MTTDVHQDSRIFSPVERLVTDPSEDKPELGIALCLSGGGYRAMVFHLGALMRLNELGYLPRLARVSSVSGGSITAGVLAVNWGKLNFDDKGVARNFQQAVTAPIRNLASKTIDATAILEGLLLPGTVADKVRAAYQQYLFGHATLQDIPDSPRFVFNATNVQSLALWRFSKPYMRDYRVGEVRHPKVELAMAVAASSAFPPVLSPAELRRVPRQARTGPQRTRSTSRHNARTWSRQLAGVELRWLLRWSAKPCTSTSIFASWGSPGLWT